MRGAAEVGTWFRTWKSKARASPQKDSGMLALVIPSLECSSGTLLHHSFGACCAQRASGISMFNAVGLKLLRHVLPTLVLLKSSKFDVQLCVQTGRA